MKKWLMVMVAFFAIWTSTPSLAQANSFTASGGMTTSARQQHQLPILRGGLVAYSSRAYRSSRSYSSGRQSYGGGYSSYYGTSRGGSYGGSTTYGRSGIGLGHVASFGTGLLFGSMFHPFGWGMGGGYGYGMGMPGAYGGFHPFWSLIGVVIDLFVLLLIASIVIRLFRRVRRNRERDGGRWNHNQSSWNQTSNAYRPNSYENGSSSFTGYAPPQSQSNVAVFLSEQTVADACCEYVANRERCQPYEVDVELLYSDHGEFSAQIHIDGRFAPRMTETDLTDAIAEFAARQEGVSPRDIGVELSFNEMNGVHARARAL